MDDDSKMAKLIHNEKRLYDIHLKQHENQKSVLQQQMQQRKVELVDAQQDLKSFNESQQMINREIELSRPLRQKNLISELEFLQLEQRDLEKEAGSQ